MIHDLVHWRWVIAFNDSSDTLVRWDLLKAHSFVSALFFWLNEMSRLTTLKPRLATMRANRISTKVGTSRTTGSALQKRRLDLYLKNPYCAMCGTYVSFPHGFELDHKVPLHKGGKDEVSNCQILCAGNEGCHAKKTKEDMKF